MGVCTSCGAEVPVFGDYVPSHLPAHPVVEDRAGRFVFVAEPDGDGLAAVRRRPVTVGAFAPGCLEVLKGLAEGNRVVVAGVNRLQDGDDV